MKILIFVLWSIWGITSYAQQIERRIILIGDAGELNHQQETLIPKAVSLVFPGKTTAFFLGDNIYPHGMALDSMEKPATQAILRSQFEPFRSEDVPVYFIAGNHDWDKSGKLGREKLLAQEDFLRKQEDEGLTFIPQAGTAGPVQINITNQVLAIVYDSEYWVFPYHQGISEAAFNLEREKFAKELKEMVQKNLDKTILLIGHHPMRSYGEHGLKFSWKQHIFPLTGKFNNLYVPLPILGSLYPALRATVYKTAEDLKHPVYQALIAAVTHAVADHPHVVFISGHDHGLQYIESGKFKQIVSGSGAKQSMISKGKDLMYGYAKQGFVTLDCLDNGQLKLRYYKYEKDAIQKTFEYDILSPN